MVFPGTTGFGLAVNGVTVAKAGDASKPRRVATVSTLVLKRRVFIL
jgi:hypothetical protein